MKKLNSLVFVAIVAMISNFTAAQTAPVDNNKLANGGYDVVSYFTMNKAVKGDKKFAVEYNGANYYFSSATDQKAFTADPTKYLPQCDGYCAWGVAEKKVKFPVNPETFKVIDGKLYLFFNGDLDGKPFNTKTEWNKDEKNLLNKIDDAWIIVNQS